MTDSPEDKAALEADAKAFHADDLVKRLRAGIHTSADPLALTNEAAYRIEQLQDTIEVMQHQINELEWSLQCKDDLHQQDYTRLRHYEAALSDISKMSMCMAVSYNDLAQKQKNLARAALEGKGGEKV